MRNIKKIFIVVFSLILLFAVSCSNDDKTGVKNNPSENDTEITDGETGSSGSGSEEGGGGTETPPTPSEPEIVTIEIEAKDFPPDLLGNYAHSKTGYYDTQVYSIMNEGVKTTQILATFDNGTDEGARHSILIEKWKKTTKGGKIIKLEGERDKGHGCYTVTFDYETKTISGTFKHTVADWSFSGTKR